MITDGTTDVKLATILNGSNKLKADVFTGLEQKAIVTGGIDGAKNQLTLDEPKKSIHPTNILRSLRSRTHKKEDRCSWSSLWATRYIYASYAYGISHLHIPASASGFSSASSLYKKYSNLQVVALTSNNNSKK